MKMEENFKLSSSRFHGLYRVFSIHKLKAFAYPWTSHATARSKLVKRVQRMLVKLRTQVRHCYQRRPSSCARSKFSVVDEEDVGKEEEDSPQRGR